MKNLLVSIFTAAFCFAAVIANAKQSNYTEVDSMPTNDSNAPAYATIYTNETFNKKDYFVVIQKKDDPVLRVYAEKDNETYLVAEYSAVVGLGIGDKQITGDHRTPEGTFTISSIENKSGITFNYGTAAQKKWYPGAENKPVEAYGAWFCRLKGVANNGKNISSNGIGIHGSGANEACLPLCNKPLEKGHHKRRDSAGCIRLSNSGIIHFKNNYAHVGMKIIIRAEGQGELPFETKAIKPKH